MLSALAIYTTMDDILLFLQSMKHIIFLLLSIIPFSGVYAAVEPQDEYEYVSEVKTDSGTQIIIPDDINWTQRFILTEIKELRINQETLRREINEDLNARELATVDRALSYSGNTVNFLWLIITMAVTWFWLVWWKTMRDVRENLTANFEKEVQKRVRAEQKKLEAFMDRFETEQLSQSQEILKNQEIIQFKQEAAYLWSQYNREENPATKLDLLDQIAGFEFEADIILIYTEKSQIYIELGVWDKALENAEKWLEIESENMNLLLAKAESLVMLEKTEESLSVITNILGLSPWLKEDILENPAFENFREEIQKINSEN